MIQMIIPIILKIIRKSKKIAYNGQELIALIQTDFHDQLKIMQTKASWRSPYFSFSKKEKTLFFNRKKIVQADLETLFQIFTSFTFVKEKRHLILSFS
jgi:5'(3')-deoxyribonucleotidase